jgi:Zn-dependent protease with chaperone function
MTLALAAIAVAGIAAPHLLRLQRVKPVTAITLWLSSLALRALVGVLGVVYLLFFLPRTDAFAALTHWCLHAALPAVADGLEVEGHGIGDLLLFVPGVALAGSLVFACVSTARNAVTARCLVERHVVGTGPRDSLMVGGHDVLLAVAGLARPRIVVSAGALASLDDAELSAALDHEQAHIARRHRFVMLAAIALRALGRPLPGTHRAVRELAFQLERDADTWALGCRNDRLALARAICKAAVSAESSRGPAIAPLGETGARERVGQLLDDPPARPAATGTAAVNGLAVAMVACTLALAAVLPTAALAGAQNDAHGAHHDGHCAH